MRKQKPFKTFMMSFKNGLGVCTTSSSIDDALMFDFCLQNAPKIGPRSLPNGMQRALEGVLDEDSVSKRKEEVAESTSTAVRRQNSDQFGSKIGPKSNQDGFKIESDRFPNATPKQKAFEDRLYVKFN